MDTEDGQAFIRVGRVSNYEEVTDTLVELGLFRTNTRESACECSPAATKSIELWSSHHGQCNLAPGPLQPPVLVFLECLGSGSVTALFDIHIAND
jgi:hypothetical protein